MELGSCSFKTPRLVVYEWHSRSGGTSRELANLVRALLTPRVTRWLPAEWRGPYPFRRAHAWVEQRDREGTTLVVVERASRSPVGLVLLAGAGPAAEGNEVRLGYLLAESVWGRGLASELVLGFVEWCRTVGVATIVAGVSAENVASRRVLEKCGFVYDPATEGAREQRFELRPNRGTIG